MRANYAGRRRRVLSIRYAGRLRSSRHACAAAVPSSSKPRYTRPMPLSRRIHRFSVALAGSVLWAGAATSAFALGPVGFMVALWIALWLASHARDVLP